MGSIESNQACWQNEARPKVTSGPYTPGPDEILVKNKYIGVSSIDWLDLKSRPNLPSRNPVADAKMRLRVMVHAKSFPTIVGTSFAGTVLNVGPDITTFQPNDIVAVIRSEKTLSDAQYGAFQKYVVASTNTIAKLSPNASPPLAATTIINLATVYSVLSFYMKLTKPPLSGSLSPENKDKKILIYGVSSSCGCLGIKYANTPRTPATPYYNNISAESQLRCFTRGR